MLWTEEEMRKRKVKREGGGGFIAVGERARTHARHAGFEFAGGEPYSVCLLGMRMRIRKPSFLPGSQTASLCRSGGSH